MFRDRWQHITVGAARRVRPARVQRDRLGAAQVPPGIAARDVRPVRQAINSAYTAAFRLVALVCAALALLAAAITVFTVPGRFWSRSGAADSS